MLGKVYLLSLMHKEETWLTIASGSVEEEGGGKKWKLPIGEVRRLNLRLSFGGGYEILYACLEETAHAVIL